MALQEKIPPYNVDSMMIVRDHIKAHPEQHDQGMWYDDETVTCGTTACIAGHTILLLGSAEEKMDLVLNAEHVWVPEMAAAHLGLSSFEVQFLFYTMDDNSALTMLDEMIEAGKNGERIKVCRLEELYVPDDEPFELEDPSVGS